MMNILRVKLDKKEYEYQKLPQKYYTVGGRGFIAGIMNDEVPPECYPLGSENKMIICTGPTSGLGISSGGRLSIGAKSPLTGGIKESNSGGMGAESLAALGLRGVILEGKIKDDNWYILKIDEDNVEFIEAAEYLGLGNYDVKDKLAEKYDNYHLISIGQSGEYKYHNSGLSVTDLFGRTGRMAARGGLGAVLGSKKIKGVLISSDGEYEHPALEKDEFKEARKEYHQLVANADRISVLREYGTASTVMEVQELGALPTRNFSEGQFEGAENLSGENIYDIIQKRGGEGENFEPCMKGCIIQCSNVYPDEDGNELVAPLEYETLGLIGSNLGLSDPDDVARINRICNDYGLDTIETGGVLGVMAEAGLIEFGDAEGFIGAIKEVPEDTWIGRMIGMGTGVTAKLLNVKRAPVVKNQCMSAYDPRGVKGTGVTYATSPMGADHTAGLTVFMPMDHHDKKDQIDVSRKMQVGRAAYDTLGLCVFLMAATAPHPEVIVKLINSIFDLDKDEEFITELGEKTIKWEKEFNRKAGFDKSDNRIPEYFKKEALPPFNLKWDFEDEELDSIFEDLE